MTFTATSSGTFSRADLQRAIQEKEEEIRQKTQELKELKELLQCLTPDEDPDENSVCAHTCCVMSRHFCAGPARRDSP
jgi:hypothetical protein